MIVGIGIDLVEIERMAEALARHAGRFAQRVFLPDEQAYCEKMARGAMHYAARFAAKEAAWKALGLPGGLPWRQIEITRTPAGQPGLRLHGDTEAKARARGIDRLHLSMSHTETIATAMVIAERAS